MLQVHESSNPLAQLHAELQSARCMSTKYKHDIFPRCNSCIRRWAGDVCRFQSLRIFMKNEKKEIVGMSFVNHQRAEKGVMEFPKKWNGEQTEENILWTMVCSVYTVHYGQLISFPACHSKTSTPHPTRRAKACRYSGNHTQTS